MIEVTISGDAQRLHDARKWCIDNIGFHRNVDAVDSVRPRWYRSVVDNRKFRFRDEDSALMFKLRWQ